ncbi:hypothetical protein CLU80_5232 [Pseudomonas sp. 29]|uniref:hypothetical protein n=1 Tax=Pseudomonas sp. 29 TaxID=2035197 RepID=UPI000C178BF8|nr:hypothetical protein [Pseudomonas sp. 29]PIF52747.1 hypothetical protein CLU80_5232 [Pseudomonas sp. 29]
MKKVISSIESTADSLLKICSAALKFTIGLGSACVIIYALRIGHFPQGVTLGDGLLFLLAACCFGAVYVLFVASLTSLGICMSIVLRPLFRVFHAWTQRKKSKPKKMKYELARFHGAAIPFAVIGVVLILVFGQQEKAAYWQLTLLSVALYIFYSIAKGADEKRKRNERLLSTLIHTPEKACLQKTGNAEHEKSAYLVSLTVMMLTPILFGGVSGQLIDTAMRVAQVRIEKPTLYLKAPYSSLIPDALVAKDFKAPEGYKAYAGVTVEFKGFGSSTVISFPDGKIKRQLEIPNNQIIVEKKTFE